MQRNAKMAAKLLENAVRWPPTDPETVAPVLDNDEAGQRANERWVRRALDRKTRCDDVFWAWALPPK